MLSAVILREGNSVCCCIECPVVQSPLTVGALILGGFLCCQTNYEM